MGKIIGIDLGTTNSLVSVWENGRCQLVPNAFGEYLTPSIVSFDADGTVYVGKIAKERLVSHPLDTVSVFKRFMGTPKTYQLAGRQYKPEEISALVLRRLKEDAENYLQEEIEEAIISVPAYFNDLARNATKNAGKLAGLKVDRIINEPSAAALAYQNRNHLEDATMLIFDFGGGTVDVSLVECFENIVEILAVSGDNRLGGTDFDRAIAGAFCKEHGLGVDTLTVEEKAIIEERAVQCKLELTEQENAVMHVELKGIQLTMEMSRIKLIQIAEPLFLRMGVPVQRVLADGKKSVEDLDAVVLVGGSSKMPVVQKYLQHMLGRADISVLNPDHMIAMGVGVYAGIKERNEEIRDMMLTDICPFSLGTGIHNEAEPDKLLNKIIIERNSALPASREEVLQTVRDNQTQIRVQIYQGEEMYVKDNLKLGELLVYVSPEPAGNQKISVRYSYDINGILVVDITVLATGETKQLVIQNEKICLSEEEVACKLEELKKLKIHPRDQEENRILLARAERLYKETVGDLRETIEARAKYFHYLLDKQDELRIRKWKKQFTDFLDSTEEYLASIIYPADSIQNFVEWYEQGGVQEEDKPEWQEEEDIYEMWRSGHLTS